jgi:hypothetical protein
LYRHQASISASDPTRCSTSNPRAMLRQSSNCSWDASVERLAAHGERKSGSLDALSPSPRCPCQTEVEITSLLLSFLE